MDHRSLSNLMLRLTGVIIVISSVLAIPRTIISLATATGASSVIPYIPVSAIAALLPVLVGLVLILFPGSITNKLIGSDNNENQDKIDNLNLQQLAFCVLGLYFISNSLFDAVYFFARLKIYYSVIAAEPSLMKPPAVLPDDFAGMVSTAMQFIFGLFVLFGAKGISNFVAKFRG